jgi:ribulose-phosphate 3-epimerase
MKVRRLRELLTKKNLGMPIAVDGGIDPTTAQQAVESGANVLIAGSSIYNEQASVVENVKKLRASARSGLYEIG